MRALANPGTPASVHPLALPVALLYTGLLFTLPEKALPQTSYAILVVALSATYVLAFFRDIIARLPLREYGLFAALVLVWLLLSRLGLLREPDRLYAAGRVLPQAAGLLILLVTLPAFTHAARALFLPRPRLVSLVLLVGLLSFAMRNWRADEQMLRDNGLYGVLSPGMMLQFVYFALVMRAENRLLRLALIVLPMPFLLAASNVAIQLMLAIAVAIPRPRRIVPWLGVVLAASVLTIAFPPAPVQSIIASDDNITVRSRLWAEALDQIPHQPLGVGFGQSSVTLPAIKDPWIRHVFSQEVSRSLEVSNHSTFLDMALRLGWGGLVLFLLLIWRAWRASAGGGANGHGYDAHATGVMAFMLVECAFNPVLESARAAMFFAFALGYLLALGNAQGAPARTGHIPPDMAGTGDLPAQRRRDLAALAKAPHRP